MRRQLHVLFSYLVLLCLLLSACGGGLPDEETTFDPDDPDLPNVEGLTVDGSMLRLEPETFADRGGEWRDFEFSFVYHPVGEGIFEIGLRVNPDSRYVLAMDSHGVFLRRDFGEEHLDLAAADVILDPDIWHEFVLIVEEGHIAVFHFGEAIIDVSDPDPLPPGGLTFETLGALTAEIDDPRLTPIEIALDPELTEVEAPVEEEEQAAQADPQGELSRPDLIDASALASRLPIAEWEWVRLGGPPGGTGYDIRYNFDDPNIWYVTDANSGVHISTDNGLSWQESNSGLPGLTGPTSDAIGIFCLTVDPHDPNIIWIGTIGHGHVYRSTDGGQSWESRENGIVREYDQLTFRGFTVDPRSSDIVYAMAETNDESLGGPKTWLGGVGGVIFKTTDAGENWQKIWDGGMPSSLARYMWINPDDPDILYVSTGIFDRSAVGEEEDPLDPWGGLGVLKSSDGGQTWEIQGKESGLRNLYIGSLFMHPDNPDVLLAAAGNIGSQESAALLAEMQANGKDSPMGVYRTENGGDTWQQVLAGFEMEAMSSVELCPNEPDIGYASSIDSMYRTEDGGRTWTLAARPWSPPGILAGFPIDMQCDARNSDRVFVNNYGGGNYLSEDGGLTWVSTSVGYTGSQIFDIAFDPDFPQLIYVETFGGVWRSADAGDSWTGIRFAPMGTGYRVMAVNPDNPLHVFAGEYNLVESFDGGNSWTEIFKLSDYYDDGLDEQGLRGGIPVFAFAPTDSKRIYVAFGHELCALNHEPSCKVDNNYRGPGVIVSEDGGSNWQIYLESGLADHSILALAVSGSNPDLLFAATTGGVFKSTDGAESWNIVGGLPEGPVAYSIAVDPMNSDALLVGIDRDGLYQSQDGGLSWSNVSVGVEPNGSFSSILFDPVDSNLVFASDLLSGVYHSTDGGSTWAKINTGLQSRAISEIVLSANGNHLYAGSNEDGMYRLDINGIGPLGE